MRCFVSATWIKTSLLPLYTASWLFASWSREGAIQEVDTWRVNPCALWVWNGRRLSFYHDMSMSCSWERTFAPQIGISFQTWEESSCSGCVSLEPNNDTIFSFLMGGTSFDVGQALQAFALCEICVSIPEILRNLSAGSLWVHTSLRCKFIISCRLHDVIILCTLFLFLIWLSLLCFLEVMSPVGRNIRRLFAFLY